MFEPETKSTEKTHPTTTQRHFLNLGGISELLSSLPGLATQQDNTGAMCCVVLAQATENYPAGHLIIGSQLDSIFQVLRSRPDLGPPILLLLDNFVDSGNQAAQERVSQSHMLSELLRSAKQRVSTGSLAGTMDYSSLAASDVALWDSTLCFSVKASSHNQANRTLSTTILREKIEKIVQDTAKFCGRKLNCNLIDLCRASFGLLSANATQESAWIIKLVPVRIL